MKTNSSFMTSLLRMSSTKLNSFNSEIIFTVTQQQQQKKKKIRNRSLRKAKNLNCCMKQIYFPFPPLQILRSVRYILSKLFVEAFHAT